MTDPHQIFDEFFDSSMSREDLQRLDRMICSDDEFALAFAHAALMESHLCAKYQRDDLISIFQMGEGAHTVVHVLDSLQADYQSADPMLVDLTDELTRRGASTRISSTTRRKPGPADTAARVIVIPRAVVWTLAAMVVVAVWFGWSLLRPERGGTPDGLVQAPTDGLQQPVATLVSAVDARWSGGAPLLKPGSEAVLQSGLAEVKFDDGALLIVQGPASFIATGPNSVRLTGGRVTAAVPPSAVGFRVELPNATVTDLGTEFGVVLDADGLSRTEVFSGLVQLHPSVADPADTAVGVEPIPIRQQQAVTVDALGQAAVVDPEPLAFVRPDEYQVIRGAREGDAHSIWLARQYQIRRDPDVIAYYLFDEADERAGRLINHASMTHGMLDAVLGGKDGPAPLWRGGRLPDQRSLEFGFAGTFKTRQAVVADDPALQIDHSLTLSAWVYVEDARRPPSGTLLSKRDVATERMAFQFAMIGPKDDGGGYVLQLGLGEDSAKTIDGFVYSKDLVGRILPGWNQLAVTADGHTVRFYLNGQPVAEAVQPYPSYSNRAPLLIGSSRPDLPLPLAYGPIPFEGRIGEVLIAKRVFSAEEIAADYQYGSRLR